MGEVIDFRDFQAAADRWLQGNTRNINRMAAEILSMALDGSPTVYETSLGYFVDTAPSEYGFDSGDAV